MEVENYFEIVPAGNMATVQIVEGFALDFFNIALQPSEDQSNSVKVFMVKDEKPILLCILDEKAGMYQIKTNIEIETGSRVIFQVIGKGTVTFSGITYKTNFDDGACSCEECGMEEADSGEEEISNE
ncbi:hypothetical protein KM1_318040 [Entamoeba histolytica HM-3:IMSS]|uniref:Nucleoplasmin-like domain-containing protein n=5 Tax=Entamoeba histolytica TaxID=5759 RepID=C4M6H5_ENTH1|nr:hypothetical protein EHI_099720 [Entamoeba histolytica HM-1:IMSS]EMD47372.1 Hypothetical protein EHI5A_255970 [Entamoeba histolytica KU27]EMS16771.1 hypothetical protein KM1_318040 [Entamoeba histolytica HM-3:IMSS]BAN39546.1 hypothetical protein [Entamoeba histolytica]EAL45882.2 hypothetical protein EHI_099720 [Entamoeba histolytica HM-1:IMSS]GAT97070.1 hypothetical protein CL6EHI_099720 [Entamoeba histolytica]|eukprot:XP_651268.2 hypothetical protein EHI_099720 [Entamoeba histolytica HM-1:IMSS]